MKKLLFIICLLTAGLSSQKILAKGFASEGHDESNSLPTEFSVSPTVLNLSSASSTYNSIYVNAPGNWSLISSPSWFSLFQTTGYGSQPIGYSVSTNNGPDRSGIVTFYDAVNSQIFEYLINQSSYYNAISLYSINTGSSYLNLGSKISVSNTVYINDNNSWSLLSAPGWVSVSNNSGTGSQYITISATTNTGLKRNGVVEFKDINTLGVSSILVTQASTVDGFSVTPSAIIAQPASFTTAYINLKAPDSWSISSYPSWLNLSPTSGIGNQSISYNTNYNPGLNRFGTITFFDSYSNTNNIVTVTQPGSVLFQISPTNLSLGAISPISSTLTILAYNGWNVTEKPSWISVSSTSGNGSGSLYLSAQANDGQVRSGTLTIYDSFSATSNNVTIQQASTLTAFSVIPVTTNFASASGTYEQIQVNSAGEWSVLTSLLPSWLYVDPSSGIGNTSISASSGYNGGGTRSGIITFFDAYSSSYAYITITQPGYGSFNVSPSNLVFGNVPTTQNVQLTSNGNWYISSIPYWLSSNISSGYGSANLQLIPSANSGTTRSGTINIYDYNSYSNYSISVSQTGTNTSSLSVIPSNISFNASSPTTTNIYINSVDPWNIIYIPSWINASLTSGNGSQNVNLNANPYFGSSGRTDGAQIGYIAIRDAITNETNYVCVTQSNSSPTGILTVTALNITSTYGSTINNLPYTITGFVNGDNLGILSGTPAISSQAINTSPAGISYPISINACNLSAGNYDFVSQNGTVTVLPALLTVSATNLSKTLGSANPTFTYQFSGFVNGESQNIISGIPFLSSTADASSPVGNYPITVSLNNLSAPNYSIVTVNGRLTVTTSTSTITGLKTELENEYYILSPNPTNGSEGVSITIPSGLTNQDVDIRIVSSAGQEIRTVLLNNVSNVIYLPLNDLGSGLYLINLYLKSPQGVIAKSFKVAITR